MSNVKTIALEMDGFRRNSIYLSLNKDEITFSDILTQLHEINPCINQGQFYLLHNGRVVRETDVITDAGSTVYVVHRLVGGKGGFGSMLRAIGAQIEKTTNREACRDLSGRRLRDINEEKRLKNWIAQQAEREQEVVERRRKKLERLCAEPRHEFKDKDYEQERSQLVENVSNAVEQGFKVVTERGTSTGKRKTLSQPEKTNKKKPRLWMDADENLSSSLDSDTSSDEDVKSEVSAWPTMKNEPEPSTASTSSGNKPETTLIKSEDESTCEAIA
uniref:SDE2-like domain-containing protein n=1 Tax=Timema cristinae TaxID=61476 RepID=A0A7R9D5F6_TIMCR|nr:unnamed protein product [Timema cristinae]